MLKKINEILFSINVALAFVVVVILLYKDTFKLEMASLIFWF